MTVPPQEPRLAVVLDLFFKEEPLERRIQKLAECGFQAVETWGGADPEQMAQLARACRSAAVELVSVVVNFASREALAPVRPANRQRFLDQVDRCADLALEAGCCRGVVTSGAVDPEQLPAEARRNLVEGLVEAGQRVASRGFLLNLEPLNTVVDHPGCFLESHREGVAVIREVGLPNVRLLMDVYHAAMMNEDPFALMDAGLEQVGHIHVAGCPGRHEPAGGRVDYPRILRGAYGKGYAGFAGLEYVPCLPSRASLLATRDYLLSPTPPP